MSIHIQLNASANISSEYNRDDSAQCAIQLTKQCATNGWARIDHEHGFSINEQLYIPALEQDQTGPSVEEMPWFGTLPTTAQSWF
jgi:hypothetical protein